MNASKASSLHKRNKRSQNAKEKKTTRKIPKKVSDQETQEMEQQHPGGGKKSNKITEIVRLQQMLKKWRKLSVAPKDAAAAGNGGAGNGGGGESKAKKFLKRTLSFTDGGGGPSSSPSAAGTPPRGHLAVCVGPSAQRFVIPTEYLKHRAFAALLREAEEEFGFQQEGVLRIPCEVPAFEAILKAVEKNKKDNAAAFCYCSYEYAADEVALGTPNNPLCR